MSVVGNIRNKYEGDFAVIVGDNILSVVENPTKGGLQSHDFYNLK